jgi:hypothetical protein
VGLCATDFDTISSGKAISSYFTASTSTSVSPKRVSTSPSHSPRRRSDNEAKEAMSSEIDPSNEEQEYHGGGPADTVVECTEVTTPESSETQVVDPDLELARKLQATYDREERSLQVMEKQRSYIGTIKNRLSNGGVSKTKQVADRKINSFFSKK